MHVCIWRCEVAVLCGNVHIQNFTHSFMPVIVYINDAYNVIFTQQWLSKDQVLDGVLAKPKLQSL